MLSVTDFITFVIMSSITSPLFLFRFLPDEHLLMVLFSVDCTSVGGTFSAEDCVASMVVPYLPHHLCYSGPLHYHHHDHLSVHVLHLILLLVILCLYY